MSSARDLIITLPNIRLRQPSRKIAEIDESIQELSDSMQAALLDWEASREHEVGVALAAVQIDQPLKLVVVRNNYEHKEGKTFTVLINPVITKLEGEQTEDFEGCLSVPDIYGKVPRFNKVRIKAQDITGKNFRLTAEGFLARVLQHEIDHTKGVVYVDHIKRRKKAFFYLDDKGELVQLDYDKDIRNSPILW